MTTIAKRQPMASDLREVMSAIRSLRSQERIGDLAKNLAKRTHASPTACRARSSPGQADEHAGPEQLQDAFRRLYPQGCGARPRGVAFGRGNRCALQFGLPRAPDLYDGGIRTIGLCAHLLFAAKNIERIGDHTTNIAENVYYLVHGS